VKSVALVPKRAKSSLAAAAKKARPLRKRLTKAGAVLGRATTRATGRASAALGRATTRATGLVKKNPVRAALGAAAVVLAIAKLRRSV
jgi:hypothetical protein